MYKITITGVPLQVLVSACMYLGQLLVGFTISWSSPNISKLQDLETSPLPFEISDTHASLIASLLYVGCIPGPYITGWLSNTKGRKPCFLLGGVLGIVGYILLATTRTLAMLYCGRILTAVATGCLVVMVLVYVGEIASTNIRGVLLTIVGIFTTCGSITLFSLGSFLSYHAINYVAVALFTLFTVCSLMIPETPIYYLLKDNDNDLKKILKDLGRLEDADKLIASKKEYKTLSNMQGWRDLFVLKGNRKALFIVLSINVLQHCSGVMAIVFFSSTIFKIAGSSIDGNIAMIIIGGFQLFGSVLTPIFIEKIGRKKVLMISCVMCSLAMLSMGVYFYLVHVSSPVINNITWLPLLILIIFFIAYDSGLGIIPNVLIGEMFTPSSRSNGSAVAITTSWVSGFLVTTAFGSVISKVGAFLPFWFFSATCALAFLFTYIFIPETKGRSLLEIQEDLVSHFTWVVILPSISSMDVTLLINTITNICLYIISSYVSIIIGPDPCLFLGEPFNVTAIILIVLTRTVTMVYAVRIISGLGMSIVTVSNLVYSGLPNY